MKHLFLILFSIVLLASCTNDDPQALETRKKPRIPQKAEVERVKIVQADILDAIDDKKVSDEVDFAKLVESINQDLGKPTINSEDIERGWYFGGEPDKKTGTPGSWLFVDDGINSRWSSPGAVDAVNELFNAELCNLTGGTYITSCIEEESEGCEYISESECRCEAESKLVEDQGCVLFDEEGEAIAIADEELNQGWYLGGIDQKKLNTPLSWVWAENGVGSRWQNPSPRR